MSMKRRFILITAGVFLLGGLTAGLLYWLWPPYHFATVDEGILYRSGQNGARGLEKIEAAAHIRTIVDLCQEKRDTREAREERQFARERGINYIHLPVPHGMVNADREILKFFDIMDDKKNHPVLVHCWKGVKRTGVMVAVYKMEYHRIPLEQALEEMPAFGRELERFQESEIDAVKEFVPRWKRKGSPGEAGAEKAIGAREKESVPRK